MSVANSKYTKYTPAITDAGPTPHKCQGASNLFGYLGEDVH